MNNTILPPNQQEGSQSQMRPDRFVVRGGERQAEELAEPSSKKTQIHRPLERQKPMWMV
jgi:hypothetical protein